VTDVEAPAARYERRGSVALITINRPEARNAVSGAVSTAVGDALQRAQDDSEVWAVIITGAGDKSFCAGADLKAISRRENLFHPQHPEWGFAGYVSHFIDKPTHRGGQRHRVRRRHRTHPGQRPRGRRREPSSGCPRSSAV
jgi:crotonobetainyl-CoA hydratase